MLAENETINGSNTNLDSNLDIPNSDSYYWSDGKVNATDYSSAAVA